ncbi:MAG TPA: thiamine phosphate synthase [Pyrinomonadaceae bacterium]|nr:thiamine phosphate synthase [Pyrinomonadaceae bacterium]
MRLDLAQPIVYLITDGRCDATNFEDSSRRVVEIATAAVDSGVDLIQIREKRLTGKLLFELTRIVGRVTRDSPTRLLVNDRFDIAMMAHADGVHLTSASLPAATVREHTPAGFLIGVSTHTSSDILDASVQGADFAVFGPVFATPEKGDGVGLGALSEACAAGGDLPVLAIGGTDESNYRSVLDAGASGFAAIRAMNNIDPMRRIMQELRG